MTPKQKYATFLYGKRRRKAFSNTHQKMLIFPDLLIVVSST